MMNSRNTYPYFWKNNVDKLMHMLIMHYKVVCILEKVGLKNNLKWKVVTGRG